MDFDMMLVKVGEFGVYQKLLFLFQAPFAMFVTWVLFGQIFIILFPQVYWCGSRSCPTLINDSQRANFTSPFGNPCMRFRVNDQNVANYITNLTSSGFCIEEGTSPSQQCIENISGGNNNNQRDSRQYPPLYNPRNPPLPQRPYFPQQPFDRTTTVATTTTTRTTPASQRGGGGGSTSTSTSGNPMTNSEASQDLRQCVRMSPTAWLNNSNSNWPTEPCGNRRFSHNTTQFYYSTIITQANYWCDQLPMIDLDTKIIIAQSIFYLGAIIGGFVIGYIADNYGRVPALVCANVIGCIGGCLTVSTTNFYAFCIFRFVAGCSFDNCFSMIYILVLEYVGPSYRTLVANLSIAIFYTLGTLLIPGLFELIQDWQYFYLVLSLPMLLGLAAIFVVPESARWLLSKGKTKEATNIMRSFAKINGKTVEEKVFIEFEENAQKMYEEFKSEKEVSLLDALKRPRLLKNFVLLICIWSLTALIYDGHSRNILNLGSSPVVMFAIAASTELPADLLLVFLLDVIGRRWLAFISLFLSGLFSLTSAIPPIAMENTTLLVFAIISRFWTNVSVNIGLQYAAELLPTVIRAQGVNFIHIMGYVASIVSPFIASLGRSNPSLSLSILGVCAITGGILCLFLPETLGEDLPNTLEDGEAFGKFQSFWTCPMCSKPKEAEETPMRPQDPDQTGVAVRNSYRASLRGETFRSSILSRNSRDRISRFDLNPPEFNPAGGAETVKLRRVYTR